MAQGGFISLGDDRADAMLIDRREFLDPAALATAVGKRSVG